MKDGRLLDELFLELPVDLRFATDGGLYVLLRNAWVIDNKFEPCTGSLLQIRYAAGPHRNAK